MITERIHKREAEKKELEKQLAIEIKKQSGMEYSVILSFLDYLRMLPNDNEYKRRALVNIFINAIYLYDGYFTMILNAGNRPLSVENIPLDDIEKAFENDDVGCSSNSQLVADAPPKSANPNVERCSDFAYSAPPAQYDPNLILWEGIRIVVFIYFARRLAERKAWSAGKAAMVDEIRRNRAAASGLVFIHPEKCAVIR